MRLGIKNEQVLFSALDFHYICIDVNCLFMAKIPYHKIENFSNKRKLVIKGIPVIKNCNYMVLSGISVTGDAPKAIVRIHNKNENRKYFKRNCHRWSMYIAKTGHKWYPIESLTEYLLSLLGEDFGLNMAESSIAIIGGQLRFLSKYFITSPRAELVHGADIFAGYLGDKDFVEQVEEQALSRDLFTLQFVEKAIDYLFPFQKEEIMNNLVRLLLYDALVGNNDRHFYNWGIIRSINQSFTPYFSPVYDTARGLFWNDHEEKIIRRTRTCREREQYIQKYCKISRPKIGWEGEKDINHFKIVEKIYNSEFYISKTEVKELFLQTVLDKMFETIDSHFSNLFSNTRVELIKECLKYRHNEINKILI